MPCIASDCDFKSHIYTDQIAHFFEKHYLNSNSDVHPHSGTSGGQASNGHTEGERPAKRKKAFFEQILEFYMNLIHKYSVSEILAKEITNNLVLMIQINQERVKGKVMTILRRDQVNPETIEKIEQIFKEENTEIKAALDFINNAED